MNGYLNESNFMMVEEGFTSRDLLESTLVELCRTVGRAALLCSASIPPLEEVVTEQQPLLTSDLL